MKPGAVTPGGQALVMMMDRGALAYIVNSWGSAKAVRLPRGGPEHEGTDARCAHRSRREPIQPGGRRAEDHGRDTRTEAEADAPGRRAPGQPRRTAEPTR